MISSDAEAYVRLLFERDIFDDTLTFNADYLQILGRSVVQAGLATLVEKETSVDDERRSSRGCS
mgnify:CR=1 FL=1